MPIERFNKFKEAEKALGFVNAVSAGGLLHISGAVSWDAALVPLHPGDMAAQMGEVYRALRATLASFGVGFDAVIKETVFVTDIDAALASAGLRREFFPGERFPAATWVEVRRLVHLDLVIEVEMIALLPD